MNALSLIRREYRKTLWNRRRESERTTLRQLAISICNAEVATPDTPLQGRAVRHGNPFSVDRAVRNFEAA